jgi:hypothetical protein
VLLHGGLEFPIRQILDAPVDAERQIAPGTRGADTFDGFDHRMLAVLDHALGTGLSAQPFVVGQLQPFLTDVVDVGEAQYLRGDLTIGVIAAVFALQGHARRLQCADLLGDAGSTWRLR